MLLALNLNDRVRVKLTTMGIALLWKRRVFLTGEERNRIAAENHQWTTTLWQLFQVFGGPESWVLGEDAPFEGCRIELVEPWEEEGGRIDADRLVLQEQMNGALRRFGVDPGPDVYGSSAERWVEKGEEPK